ncbi:MAG: hypothetical protein M3406_05475 [Chloroflexota bacterium]|nr:hypothetical protein [Chloroflexota bacterium]
MKNRSWTRRLLVAGVWAMAMSTWGSIGHHLLGLIDFGPLLVAVSVAVVLAWPVQVRDDSMAGAGSSMRAETGAPSQA